MLGRIEIACEDLLARCMENYYSLSENSPSGIAENGMDTSEQPAPALVEAVLLCSECLCLVSEHCNLYCYRIGKLKPETIGHACRVLCSHIYRAC